jgi:hypothetical protein
MGWERRERGGSYFYRKEREGGRVRSIYVGKGELAGLIAQLENGRRTEREMQAAHERNLRAIDERVDASLDELSEMAETLTAAVLLASGYHTHKRQWRRARI